MQFLRQQLHDLPDERKPGNNTRYEVEDAVMARANALKFYNSCSAKVSNFSHKTKQWLKPLPSKHYKNKMRLPCSDGSLSLSFLLSQPLF